ncbi:hypothetical protein NEOKW01_0282 [Nematocida sp. AWRm80]|nr:hypothetical protein NEOKW01_0282 [Nematocida sp. AWRm80]
MNEKEYTEEILSKINKPFEVNISETTFKRIEEIALSINDHYPRTSISKVLGELYSRLKRNTLRIPSRSIGTEIELTENKIVLVGIPLGIPLGLEAIAYAVEKGCKITEEKIEILSSLSRSSYLVLLAQISFFKTVLLAGEDKNSLCYGKLIDLIGHTNTQVKIKAISTILRIGCSLRLIEESLSGLEEDIKEGVPNPRWAPGILCLLGVYVYRTKSLPLEKQNRILKVVEEYICKSKDISVLNGVLVILWAFTQTKHSRQLPYLAVLSLFCHSKEVRKDSLGILAEYTGYHHDRKNIDLLENYKTEKKNIKSILKRCKVKKNLLLKYSYLLISEGIPDRIKVGVRLWRLSNGNECMFKISDPFERVAAMRVSLKNKDTSLMSSILDTISVNTLSPLVKIDLETIRLALRLILSSGISCRQAEEIVLFAIKKELFPRIVVTVILRHKESANKILSKCRTGTKTSTLYLVYASLGLFTQNTSQQTTSATDTTGILSTITASTLETGNIKRVDGDISLREMQFRRSIRVVYIPPETDQVYIAWALCACARGYLTRKQLKTKLFSMLDSYETDPHLGDIGAQKRIDSLYILSLPLIDKKKCIASLPHVLSRSNMYSVIASQLVHSSFSLSPAEYKRLQQYILKLSIDRSKKISQFIFESLLPAFNTLPRPLRQLYSSYQRYIQKYPEETAIILSMTYILKKLLRKHNCHCLSKDVITNGCSIAVDTTRHDINQSSICTKEQFKTKVPRTIKMVVHGIINTFVSSDAYLSSKLISYCIPLLRSEDIVQVISEYTQSFYSAASRRIEHTLAELQALVTDRNPIRRL